MSKKYSISLDGSEFFGEYEYEEAKKEGIILALKAGKVTFTRKNFQGVK